jgi:hypothetical protein
VPVTGNSERFSDRVCAIAFGVVYRQAMDGAETAIFDYERDGDVFLSRHPAPEHV